MNLIARSYYNYRRFSKAFKLYLLLAGPGLIVMIADNDAGGITTYATTGAQYGYNLIWFLVLLLPVAYFVQEMTVRLGAVTKHGHAEAIFDAFGSFWGWFSLFDLGLVNWLTLITEFIGMTAALSIFGIPAPLTIAIVCLVMFGMVLQGRYWTWEKIAMVFCVLNLVYIPAAFLVHPSVPDIISHGLIPNFPGGLSGDLFFILMANIGTTIAPWMVFFQQSAVVDKGMSEKDIPWGKFDTLLGSFVTVIVAIFIVLVTGTVLRGTVVDSAAQASVLLMTVHPFVGTMLAIGLFNAGFLGAICISLASSWAFGEVFGWAHSLNNKVREAPWFYVMYLATLITAGLVVLIPKAPLVVITLFVQVIAVTLLPAALVFLILLLNNEEIMGKYRNTLLQNVVSYAIVALIIVLSTMYAINTLFPGIFGGAS
ncbi:Nramp family divalent metal transporter [Methanosphaerula palustris]|uniref:Natural resistance-associated macrophage protein n=1 Tax=Methanosphaerula palustris (strain ATCC BAA-1556 / DSM 19958 / E1-9c) TaxID=521011 RepID=B8GID3_METPE|nr:Nramp family divalent metal transporter [Methanosphaerula palustris]ACL15484.1 natural resistance-associated macrophage protein [Methanosphaerula palustris E1-9c]